MQEIDADKLLYSITLLLENDANVNGKLENGGTTLFAATQEGHAEVYVILTKNGKMVKSHYSKQLGMVILTYKLCYLKTT